jgi:hypothetical protein
MSGLTENILAVLKNIARKQIGEDKGNVTRERDLGATGPEIGDSYSAVANTITHWTMPVIA